jgi:predicted lipase
MKDLRIVRPSLLFLCLLATLSIVLPEGAYAQSSINWLSAIQYAKLTKIAESVSPTSEYSDTEKQLIAAEGYTYLQTIYGSDLGTDAHPALGVDVSYGYLALSPKGELVVAIRGTDTILEWIDDAQFYFVYNPIKHSSGFTEDGFTTIYKSLRIAKVTGTQTLINSIRGYIDAGTATNITLTGHSLGGALVTLLALDVAHNTSQKSPILYTFASPRVGEELFAYDFNDTVPTSYHVYHTKDVVPLVPLWPYTSVKSPFALASNSSTVKDDVACAHHLTTYLWLMGNAANVNAGSLDADCVPGN